MALILRSEIGRRLTVPEIDGNFTYLENLAMGLTESSPYQSVELTYTQALSLLASEGVVDGKRYLITEFDVELYGGTDILVSGLPNNQFSTSGYGKFYNPIYGTISVWDPLANYSINGLAIYGGKVWKNLTGSVGSSTDNLFNLDNTNWELQEDYTNTAHYDTVWEQIEIGYGDGAYRINSRYDSLRNNYVRVGQLDNSSDRWFFCGVNPLQVFAWGNNNINDCDIIDSYFNCLNIIGDTTIYGVDMSNYSYIFATVLRDAYIEGISFKNESGTYELNMKNCYFRYCKFENNSNIYGTFESSTIENLNLSNNSYVNNIGFYNSSLSNVNLNNNSYLSNITASASYFQYVDMTNNSYIENIDLSVGVASNSYFQRANLSNRSYISNIDLYDSTMYELTLDNYSYIDGSTIDLYNSQMTYISLNNHSRISGNIGLSSSYFKRIDMSNRSRIQGNITLNNSSYIEKLTSTNDSYINSLYFYNGSNVVNLDISNSNFTSINLYGSNITNISLDTTYFSSIGLSASELGNIRAFNSYVENIDIRNSSSLTYMNIDRSNFSNFQSYDNAGVGQIDLNSTYLSLSALGTFSRTFPSGTSFRFNELKYQFDLTFDGSSGYGLTNNALNIPAMLIPNDFYIEKVIIESSDLIYSGGSATFSFTMPGGLSPSTVEIAVSDISNKIQVLDISNGLIFGTKADGDKMLMAFLTGGTNVTSGGIKMEVTIKNTRYFYD